MTSTQDRLIKVECAMGDTLFTPQLREVVKQGQCSQAQADQLTDISSRIATCEAKLFRKLQLPSGAANTSANLTVTERLEAIEAGLFRLLSNGKIPSNEQAPSTSSSNDTSKVGIDAPQEKKRPGLTRKPSKIQAFLEAEAIRAALQGSDDPPAMKESAAAPKPPSEELDQDEDEDPEAAETIVPQSAPKAAVETAPRVVNATEASYGISASEKQSFHASKSMSVDGGCAGAFKELKTRRKHRYIFYGISGDVIKTSTLGKRSASFDDFLNALPDADCRYVVYDHEYKTKDGRLADKLLFITWCPAPAPTTIKMLYTTERPRVSPWITGALELTASSRGDIKDFLGVEDAEENESDDDWMDN